MAGGNWMSEDETAVFRREKRDWTDEIESWLHETTSHLKNPERTMTNLIPHLTPEVLDAMQTAFMGLQKDGYRSVSAAAEVGGILYTVTFSAGESPDDDEA